MRVVAFRSHARLDEMSLRLRLAPYDSLIRERNGPVAPVMYGEEGRPDQAEITSDRSEVPNEGYTLLRI